MNSPLSDDVGLLEPGTPTTPTGSSQSQKTSALQNKITNILSASYADLEIRDSLEALDAQSLQNTPATRRNLRLDVQKEIINSNAEIVQDFGQVAKQLRNVGTALAALQKTCADMRSNISSARIETAPVLDEATRLLLQKDQLETRQTLLDAFNAHFLLTDSELSSLTSTVEAVDDAFFAALVKAKRIHKDSQVLLGTENQRLGLEILDQSSKNLNAGFQKLYRWIQREFKSLNLESPQMSTAIRRAIRVLAERPTLFQSCLDIFAQSRERNLSDAFYAALTGVSRNGDADQADTQKPIEFSAHEPLRYVGDMLAWAHSATVSEREALELLFISEGDEMAKGIREGLESEPWSRADEEDGEQEPFDGRKALGQLVNRNLTGVAQLLRQRIEQVIHAHDEPVLSYKIANLIGFYRNIFNKLLLENAEFMGTLKTLENAGLTQFRTTMNYHITNVQSEHGTVPDDLSSPIFLNDALEELKALLKSYDTSGALTDTTGKDLKLVLKEALDPFLDICGSLADSLQAPSEDIFLVNSNLAVKSALSIFNFTATKSNEIKESIEDYASNLVEFQHNYLLTTSGLKPLVNAVEALPEEPTDSDLAGIAKLAPFERNALIATSQQIDDFLPSALMDASENVKSLQNSTLRSKITSEAADRFCEDFEIVENKITQVDEVLRNMRNGEDVESADEEAPSLRECFPRTSEEVRILLS